MIVLNNRAVGRQQTVGGGRLFGGYFRKFFIAGTLWLAFGSSPTFAQTCPAGSADATFMWSTSPGSGNEWLPSNQNTGDSQTYTLNYTDTAGNPATVDVTLTLQDPNAMNCDNNLVPDPTNWPNDPDCPTNFGFTQTNGFFGPGQLTAHMKSLNSTDTVTFDFTFSKPTYINSLTVGDIDDVGFGFQPTVEPGDSFQDQVTFTGSSGGSNVPVNLVGGSNLTITGQTAAAIVVTGVNGNLGPTDAAGIVTASTGQPLDTFSIIYQNGPVDATNEGGTGVSDSHLVTVPDFRICVVDPPPQLTIDKTSSPSGAVQPGDTISYTIEVENTGTSIAADVIVTDTLPAGVTYVSGSSMVTHPEAGSGTFTSPNLGPNTFDPGGLTQSFDTTGQIPAGSTLTSYAFNVQGSSADWLSDISLDATYPSGVAFSLAAGSFGGNGPGGFNETRGPSPFGGPAEGVYQFVWDDGFNGVAGDDNTVTSSTFTITYDTPRAPVTEPAGAPPNLVTAADGFDLLPGETMTVTFDVTVDASTSGELINTATVDATGLPTPEVDTATNFVPSLDSFTDNSYTTEDNVYYRDPNDTGNAEEEFFVGGPGFPANTSFTVAYYDGHGNLVFTETVTTDASGNLQSAYAVADGLDTTDPNFAYGNWTGVVVPDGTTPAATKAAQDASGTTVIEDPFEVRSWSETEFTDAAGNPVTEYDVPGGDNTAYPQVTDQDNNTDPNVAETIQVTITDSVTGDTVTVTLTETGPNTGVFELPGGIPLQIGGAECSPPNTTDAILCVTADSELTVDYTDPGDSGDTSDDVVTNPITLASFEVSEGVNPGDVHIEWSTSMETGNVGFDLYARGRKTGWVKLNPDVIPSKVINSVTVQHYAFDAIGVKGGVFAIVDIDIEGKETVHGPFRLGKRYGAKRAKRQQTDWDAIRAEHRTKKAKRKARKQQKMQQRQQRLEQHMDTQERRMRQQHKRQQRAKGLSVLDTPVQSPSCYDQHNVVATWVDRSRELDDSRCLRHGRGQFPSRANGTSSGHVRATGGRGC